MPPRDAYRQKFDAQIDVLNARPALACAQAKRFAADGKLAAYEEIADTDANLAALKEKLNALRRASGGALKDMKGGVEKAWIDVSKAAKRPLKRFD